MHVSGFTVGQRVFFGRSRGEQTLGEIVRLNSRRAKIKQLEARTRHAIGTIWNVPYTLLSSATEPADIPNALRCQECGGNAAECDCE